MTEKAKLTPYAGKELHGMGNMSRAQFRRLKAGDAYAARQLKKLRKAAGLGQVALGNTTGFTFQRIQFYEYGTVRMSPGVIVILAQALGVEPKEFFK